MRKWLTNTMIGLAVGAAVLFTAAPARASYFYQIFDDGVAVTGIITPSGNSFSTILSTTNFDITIASSLTVQSVSMTTLNTNLQAHLNGPGTHTIEIKVAFVDYSMPAGSPLLAVSSGSANFADSNNKDFATGQAWGNAANTSAFNTGATGGKQTANSPGGDAFGVVLNPNPSSFSFARSGNFALNQDLLISLTNGTNTTGQDQFSTIVTSPGVVPAPAGLVLALTGMPVLAFGGWVRRRWLTKA